MSINKLCLPPHQCPSPKSLATTDPQFTLSIPQTQVPVTASVSSENSVSLTIAGHVFIDDTDFVEIDLGSDEEDKSDKSSVRAFFSRIFNFFKSVFTRSSMDA